MADLNRQYYNQLLLAAIVDSSEDAIVSKDLNGIVTSWNPAAERIYGWKAKDIIGKSKALVIPDDRPDELANILEQIRAGRRIEHYETKRIRKDGAIIDVAISVSPVIDQEGRIVGAATIVRDITERKIADRQLVQKHAEVDLLNARLRRAIAETHHRVKNNLQIIGSMIEMQMFEHSDGRAVPIAAYRKLQAHVHTLAIVHDLLSGNVMEGGDTQHVSTKAVLGLLLPHLAQTAGRKSVRYSIDEMKVSSKLCVSLSLVLNELVANALKHGRTEADILLAVDGATATLSVSDDGPGFPEGFDPSREAHMGLELVESLVRTDLKGRTCYSTRPEGGGRVEVTFPIPECE